MQSPFDKDFDTILAGILTDFRNQYPNVDTSQGSLIYIRACCYASALWGIYKSQGWFGDQIFPDTACLDHLQRHAYARGLPTVPGETPAALLTRYLSYERTPPAGGNRYDYPRWALEASSDVASCTVIPQGQGPGTVDLVLTARPGTGSEVPTNALCTLVRSHIGGIAPELVKYLRVLPVAILTRDVTIVRVNATFPAPAAETAITSYMAGFVPGQALYRTQLSALALGGGAGDAPVTMPAANETPTQYQMIRPGVVNVT